MAAMVATPLTPSPDTAKATLAAALVRANAAVRLDTQGQYAAALAAYKDVVARLDDATLRSLDESDRAKIASTV